MSNLLLLTDEEMAIEEVEDKIKECLDMANMYSDIAQQHMDDVSVWTRRLHDLVNKEENKDVSTETKSQSKPSNTY